MPNWNSILQDPWIILSKTNQGTMLTHGLGGVGPRGCWGHVGRGVEGRSMILKGRITYFGHGFSLYKGLNAIERLVPLQ